MTPPVGPLVQNHWIWGVPDLGVGIQGVQIQGVQNGVDFGVILRVQNSSKSAQFWVFSMSVHMYNMYLYTPYNIYIRIICVNMWNVGYEGYPMAGLGVVMVSW